jgi:Rha family phage regulatory protein
MREGSIAMNELQVKQNNGQFVIDSREVADMIGRNHKELLRDIKKYAETLDTGESAKLRSLNFFISSTYTVPGNTKKYPCYLLTRKGCDMVANKMTGEKGVLFTAAYVTKFEEMEKAQKPQTQIEILQQAINVLANHEKELQETKAIAEEARSGFQQAKDTINNIKETVISDPEHWRDDINRMFNKIVETVGGNQFKEMRIESYEKLEQRAHVDLKRRLSNYKVRLMESGASKTAINKANRMDIIEQDPKLREIYSAIIKEYTIKHVA